MLSTRRWAATARRSLSHCAPMAASRWPDRGRGIPVDLEPRTGLSGVEVVFTKLHAGGKFGAGSLTTPPAGCTASVPRSSTRLASRLDVEVDRGGSQPGPCRSVAVSRERSTGPGRTRGFTPGGKLRARFGVRPERCDRDSGHRTGPTGRSFCKDAQLSLRDLQDRARQTSYLVPGLALQITDARTARGHRSSATSHERRHLGVLRVPCHRIRAITDVIRLRGTAIGSPRRCPMLDDEGHMEPADVERDLDVDIAVSLGRRLRHRRSARIVNIIATPKGGTHVAGFERGTDQGVQRCAARHPAAQERRRGRQGRRARRHDCGRHRTAGRAAVRGPDQGGARHACRRRDS